MTDDHITETIASHPRLVGGLFTLCLLASQVGTTLADETGSAGYHGP